MSILRLHRVSKTYNGALEPALRSISYQIDTPGIYGLLGPNGAGKSTTIALICGIISATEGTISLWNIDINQQKLLRPRMGVVPQEYALFPALSAYENLHYFGNLYGLKGNQLHAQIKSYLTQFGLDAHQHKQVTTFSGGMKRRLNLIVGILHKPDLLILDEPTVGVDVHSRKMIVDFITDYQQKNQITVLYTSHHLEEAQQLCHHIAIIDQGTIIADGTPNNLLQSYDCTNLEDVFIKLTGHQIRN